MKKVLIWSILFTGSIVFFISYFSPQRSAEEAAELGMQWLRSYPDDFIDPGVLWVMHTINKRYCNMNPQLQKEIAARLPAVESRPEEFAYIRLFDKEPTKSVLDLDLSNRTQQFDHILIPALYCDIYPITEKVKKEIVRMSDEQGYELTHSMLALLWMKERACFTDAFGQNEIDTAAARVAAEQELDIKISFSDIHAERVAFLLYGGYESVVSEKWIRSIIDHQKESGAWELVRGSSWYGSGENPHTTALSVWALAQYTKKCPL